MIRSSFDILDTFTRQSLDHRLMDEPNLLFNDFTLLNASEQSLWDTFLTSVVEIPAPPPHTPLPTLNFDPQYAPLTHSFLSPTLHLSLPCQETFYPPLAFQPSFPYPHLRATAGGEDLVKPEMSMTESVVTRAANTPPHPSHVSSLQYTSGETSLLQTFASEHSSVHSTSGETEAYELPPLHPTFRKTVASEPRRGLLNDEQKRLNHIASEKKRREMIKNGYRDLEALIPDPKSTSKSAVLSSALEMILRLEGENDRLEGVVRRAEG